MDDPLVRVSPTLARTNVLNRRSFSTNALIAVGASQLVSLPQITTLLPGLNRPSLEENEPLKFEISTFTFPRAYIPIGLRDTCVYTVDAILLTTHFLSYIVYLMILKTI